MARKESSRGSVISKTGREPLSVPMVNSENGAGWVVWYSASAAAIFIGWYFVMSLPWMSPVIMVPIAATSVVMAPTFAAVRKTAVSSPASPPAAGRRTGATWPRR